MTKFSIDIQVFIPDNAAFNAKVMSNLSGAVQRAVSTTHELWARYAEGAPLPDGQRVVSRSGNYARSIRPAMTGDFSGEVSSDSPYAKAIEDGTPARDMKDMLNTSMKVRLSKTGKRYLIIPFRWGTPGAKTFGRNVMPESVHSIVAGAAFKPSAVTGMGQRLSGTGAWDTKTRAPAKVAQRKYLWGDRLNSGQIGAAGVVGPTARHMAGMVKFQNPGGEKGGGKHSQYMTFRVMVEGSPGWLVPAQPGKHVAQQVADQMRPLVEKMFAAAAAADVKAFLGGS